MAFADMRKDTSGSGGLNMAPWRSTARVVPISAPRELPPLRPHVRPQEMAFGMNSRPIYSDLKDAPTRPGIFNAGCDDEQRSAL